MDEYIKREALRNAVKENSFTKYDWSEEIDIEDFEKVLDKIPAEDVVPIAYGQWKTILIAKIDTTGECTNCGEEAVWRTRKKPYAICPNCGAKMDLK